MIHPGVEAVQREYLSLPEISGDVEPLEADSLKDREHL